MKFYVTTPIYYANAAPHIGSAYPTIAADILARHHRRKQDDTFFLTGVAEHGQKIAKYALDAKLPAQEFVDQTSTQFIAAWRALNIQYSDFIRTTEPRHEEAVKLFFERLKASGQIYEAEYQGLYCVGHEAFIKEAELTADGLCPDHKTKPEPVQETNWFFKLSEYAQPLLELIASGRLAIQPESRRNEVVSFINQGLEDITISRQNVEWAIPLPWDESQTIYVWLDELFNYCSAIGYGQDDATFKKWWPADVHIVGKDIIKFHCIIWPALLLAIGEEPPTKVFAHGFFTVNGDKISKSLGNAIDPTQLVEEYGADAVRYYLMRDISFGNDGDFSHERLRDRYNSDLANGLGNLVSRTLNMIEKYAPDISKENVELPDGVQTSAGLLVEQLQYHLALQEIWSRIQAADELIEQEKPWQLAKQGKQADITRILQHLYGQLWDINQAIAPFMPATHEKLTALLEARPVRKPAEPLFARKVAA